MKTTTKYIGGGSVATIMGLVAWFFFSVHFSVQLGGDSVCAGTLQDPCEWGYNVTLNSSLYGAVYIMNKDRVNLNFVPGMKEVVHCKKDGRFKENDRSKHLCGAGWRVFNWSSPLTTQYSYVEKFVKGDKHQYKVVALKYSPLDKVKFGGEIVGDDFDPFFLPVGAVVEPTGTKEVYKYSTGKDYLRVSIDDSVIPMTTLKSVRSGDVIEPYFSFTLSSSARLTAVRDKNFTVPYVLEFNKDVSKDWEKPLIPLGEDKVYKPYFYCEIENSSELVNTIGGQVVSRSLINSSAIEFEVFYNFKDMDLDSNQDWYSRNYLKVGHKITCYDPILETQDPNRWNGTFLWGNSSLFYPNAFFMQWGANGANNVENISHVNANQDIRFMKTATSNVTDLGIACYLGGNDIDWAIFNTTDGRNLTWDRGTSNAGSSTSPMCDVAYLPNTEVSMVLWWEGTTGLNRTILTVFNGTTEITESLLNFTIDTNGGSQAGVFAPNIVPRPCNGCKEVGISAVVQRQNQTVLFYIVNFSDSLIPNVVLNWTFPKTDLLLNPGGSNNNYPVWSDWSINGTYFFMVTSNTTGSVTGNGDANFSFMVYNRSSNQVSPIYILDGLNADIGDVEKLDVCRLKHDNDKVGAIMGSQFSILTLILDVNGTYQSGYPSADTSYESAGSRNMFCYTEEFGNETIFGYVDSNALAPRLFYYNSANKTWSVTSMSQGIQSGNICGDDCQSIIITPFPNADGFLTTQTGLDSDIWGGAYFNASSNNLSVAFNVLLETTAPGAALESHGFMFAPNLTAHVAGGADTTAPTITLTNESTTNESSSTNIALSESANCSLKVGRDANFSGEVFNVSNTTLASSHTYDFGGLSNFTLYYSNATCCDASANCASSNISFITRQNAATATNSCTYSSGDWNINCADSCSLTTTTDVSNNAVRFAGVGTVSITGSIRNANNVFIHNGCSVMCRNSAGCFAS